MTIPLLPSFRVSDALREGATRGILRSSSLEAPFHGIRAQREVLVTAAQVCSAYAHKLPRGSAFTGLTAARLWQIPLPLYVGGDVRVVQVAARRPRRAPTGAGVRGSRYDPKIAKVVRLNDLPVFSPADTWCSLAELLDVPDLVAVADYLLAASADRGRPLATRPELEQAVDRRRGMRGVRSLRVALRASRSRSWSRTESLTRQVLVSAGIPEPELNLAVDLASRRVFLDLAWPSARFAIEYDGDVHRDRQRFVDDVERQEQIQDERWSVMRMTRADLFDRPQELVRRVAARLAEHGVSTRVELRRMVRVRR